MFGIFRKREDQRNKGTSAFASLEQEVGKLRHTVQQLSLLNDLSQAIGLSENSGEMIDAVVQRAKRALAAEQVMIYFVEHTDEEDVFRTIVRDRTVNVRRAFHFDDALRAMMEIHREPFLTNRPHNEERLRGVEMDPDLRSLLCVPLMVRGRLTGLVAACNKRAPEGFDEEDKRLLSIMANQSAQILETTRLREEEEAYAKLNRDVQMARDIQMGLLPKAPPVITGYDVAGCSVPAEAVGGDYFDYLTLADGRVGLCLGDVSGKGVPASLLMANLQATLRGQAGVHESAAACVTWANRLLHDGTTPDKFATLFYGILDPNTHELVFCNAGHEPPLLLTFSAGVMDQEALEGGGPILGVIDDYTFTESRVALAPGALLVIYSDGLTDAIDRRERPFGIERVREVLNCLSHASAQVVLDELLAAVRKHGAGTAPFDDVTLLALRRNG